MQWAWRHSLPNSYTDFLGYCGQTCVGTKGVRLCDVTPTQRKWDWGLHGVEMRALKIGLVLCDSCQVMHIFLHTKSNKKRVSMDTAY